MHRENSIFYKAVKKDENHTTELLCNLFKYKYLRDILLDFFKFEKNNIKLPIDKIKYEHINTQKRLSLKTKDGQKKIQPDIIIENTECYSFFEIKTDNNRVLEDTQQKDYFDKLKETSNKKLFLIYLVPKDYKNEFKKEIRIAIEENKANGLFAKIFYWEDLIKYMESLDLQEGNLIISEFISFLKNIFKKQDLSLTLNLKEMALLFNPSNLIITKNLLNKLYQIIDISSEKVINHFKGKVSIYSKTKKDSVTNEYAVYFIDREEDYILFFGLWFDMVEKEPKYGNSLLCYGISIDDTDYDFKKYSNNFKKVWAKEEVKYGGWLLNNFNNYDLANENEEKVIKNISEILINTIEKLLK